MTCVLGMVVRREREIREFVKTPFYRVISTIDASGHSFEGEWRAVKGSRYFESFDLYKENGFKTVVKAKELREHVEKIFQAVGLNKEEAESVGIGMASQERIDEINILQATYEAMRQAIWK